MQNNETQNTQQALPSYEYNTALGLAWGELSDFMLDTPYDMKNIQNYMKEPMAFNKQLRDLAWWSYRSNGSVSSAVDYMRTMHTLDKVIVCKSRNVFNKKPKDFSKNRLTMLSTLDKIKYKQQIRDALLKIFNDGIYFYYFEIRNNNMFNKKYLSNIDISNIVDINEMGVNCSIISLPVDYCKIVGKRNGCYVGAFNLGYFTLFSDEDRQKKLVMFPRQIQEAWNKNKSTPELNSWVVLDCEKTIIDKIKTPSNEPWGIPLSITALDDVMYANYFTNTKRNILDNINSQVIYETFPEGEKGKSTLTGPQQTQQHDTVKGAVLSKNNKSGKSFFSLAAGTKIDQLKVDVSLFDEKNENAIKNDVPADLGISSSSLNGNSKGNYATSSINLELVASNVYAMIEGYMSELNKCINKNIIKDEKCIIECYIPPTTYVNKDKQVKYAEDLYTKGKGSLAAWISACGYDVEAYMSLVDYELDENWENHYPCHATSFTMTGEDNIGVGKDNSGGRPTENSPTNENTIQSKSNNIAT